MTTTAELVIKQCEALRLQRHPDAWSGLWTKYPVVRSGKAMLIDWRQLLPAEVAEIEDAYSMWAGVPPAAVRRQTASEQRSIAGLKRMLEQMPKAQVRDLIAGMEEEAAGRWEPSETV